MRYARNHATGSGGRLPSLATAMQRTLPAPGRHWSRLRAHRPRRPSAPSTPTSNSRFPRCRFSLERLRAAASEATRTNALLASPAGYRAACSLAHIRSDGHRCRTTATTTASTTTCPGSGRTCSTGSPPIETLSPRTMRSPSRDAANGSVAARPRGVRLRPPVVRCSPPPRKSECARRTGPSQAQAPSPGSCASAS
jgi:hypothetical protein